jgi:DNA-binding transcriptional LysR family regulator
LPADLARFFAKHPAVRIDLEERPSLDIVAAVAAGRADLGVIAVEQRHPDLHYVPYREDELVVLVPLNNALAKKAGVRFSSCLNEPFVSLQPGMALHTFLANHAIALGAQLDVRVQVSGYRAIAHLVASGAGIGVVPRSAVETEDLRHLAVVQLDEPWALRHLEVCRRKAESDNPFVNQLVAELCAVHYSRCIA